MANKYTCEERWMTEEGDAIVVAWGDGHVSTYPFTYLRGYCPCAACQGHGGGPPEWQSPAADLGLQGVRLVGAYGINPVWSDGHDTGIFANIKLRRMCPCSDCLDMKEPGAPLQLMPE
ncbi:MAG: DUF971 domain-containing protein [Deltaproteobacteria bacterium]|nr:DUF971 domain-containing protein [Deltaproteobacteria bacterium]